MTDLIDLGNYPEIYADDVAEIQLLNGGNRRVVFFSWRRINGVFQRMVVGAVIRPAVSIMTSFPMFRTAMDEATINLNLLQ